MKKIDKSIISLILIFTAVLFISCGNLFAQKNEETSDSDGKTYLCISVKNGKATGRTIKPQNYNKEQFTDIILSGVYENDSEQDFVITKDSLSELDKKIELLSGQWNFTLSATYNGISFTDTKSRYLQKGQDNTVSFTLEPVSSYGGCNITFTLADSVDKVEVTVRKLNESGAAYFENKSLEIKQSEKDGKVQKLVSFVVNPADEILQAGRYYINFNFYTDISGEGYKLLNQYESYLIITEALITEATVNLDFNQYYTITYQYIDADGTTIKLENPENFADDESGFIPFCYSKGSEITLPKAKLPGKVFLGWKKQGANEYISEITASDSTDFTLVAQTAEPVLYVSEDGDDSIDSNDKGFTSANPLKTIEAACKQLKQFCESDFDWTIYINGEVTGIPTGSGTNSTYGPIIMSDEENEEYGITPDHAKSITITGMNGRGADGSILAGTEDTSHNIIEPVDILNRGSTSSGRTSPVLSINTTVPVTITNLKITGGNGENGGGIFIKEGATVSIGDGVLITQNRSIRGGAIFNQGTLFIYGTAILGKIDATDYASDDSSQDSANYVSSYGGGIYNGDIAATVATTTIIAKLYLGYKLSDDGVTPVKEELKGGIYYCWANSGGGIYNSIKSLVYLDSGTIQYNGVKNYGGGLYNNDASRLEMTGGKIIKNSASQTSSVMYGGGVCNDWLNSVFIMSGGLINENRAWCTGTGTSNGQGGGVYNGGKMFMYGTAVIGNKDASASATEDSCGNKANIGGGIYNDYSTDRRGYLYIGYEPDTDGITPKEADFSGGIYNNYSKDNSNGNNKDGGGAIYSTAFPPNYGDVKIAKGTIAYNFTEDYGGAYCGKEITITGGSILNNSAGKKGGAIYFKQDSILSIGGSVQIPFTGTEETGYQNDICHSVNSKTYFTKIKILSALTNHSASNQLRITPENYHEGIQLITIDSAAETDYATELPKFVITPEIHTEYNTRADWEFNDSGKLHSTIPFADITVAFSDPDINVSVKYNNTYDAGEGLIQGTRKVIFTADPGYTYTWMLDDEIITNTEASDDAVAIISDKSDGTNNVLTINTLKLIHGGIYDVYLEATKAGIKYSYMAQMKIQNY